MRPSFFRKPVRNNSFTRETRRSYADLASQSGLSILRERILSSVLKGSLTFALLAYLVSLPARIEQRNWVMIGIYSISLICLLGLVYWQAPSYRFKALAFLSLVALLGISTLITDGLYGNGRVFLVILPVLGSLLLGSTGGVVLLVLATGVLIGSAAIIMAGIVAVPDLMVNTILAYWIVATSVFLLASGAATMSLVALFRGLQRTQDEEGRLRNDLDAERAGLESRVQQRTLDLERRLVQLRTASEISCGLSAILEPQELLRLAAEQIQRGFDLYFTGIFLLDEYLENATLRAGTGEAGRKMLAEAYQQPLDESTIVGSTILHHQPRIAFDVGREAIHFNNPYLPLTRSELVLPLIVRREFLDHSLSEGDHILPGLELRAGHEEPEGSSKTARCLGAITLQSAQPMAFDLEDQAIFLRVASGLAIALENATLYQESQRSLDEIRNLNRQYLAQSWDKVMHTRGLLTFTAGETPSRARVKFRSDIQLAQSVTDLPAMGGEEQAATVVSGATTGGIVEQEAVVNLTQVPLVLRDRIIGLLSLEIAPSKQGEGPMSPEDRAFIEAIATEAALALENVRLLEETQRRAGYERLLSSISRQMRGSSELETILKTAVKELGQALNASEAEIRLEVVEKESP